MTKEFLMIMDVQRGFLNEWTRFVPGKVEQIQHKFSNVLVTQFINPKNSLYRQLIGWRKFSKGFIDAKLAFSPRADIELVEKCTYTCLTPDVLSFIQMKGAKKVYLCGIATDNCILKTAVDLFEAGLIPIVLVFACGSHGGPDYHSAGVKLLKRFIGEEQVNEDESLFL